MYSFTCQTVSSRFGLFLNLAGNNEVTPSHTLSHTCQSLVLVLTLPPRLYLRLFTLSSNVQDPSGSIQCLEIFLLSPFFVLPHFYCKTPIHSVYPGWSDLLKCGVPYLLRKNREEFLYGVV